MHTAVVVHSRGQRAFAALLPSLCALGLYACHTFTSLENCSANGDCRLDETCNASGRFCETDTGPITFGALLPVEGTAADVGQQYVQTLDFVTHLVNDEGGGVLGRKIAFKVLQDRPTEVGTANIHTFIDQDRVMGILGGTNSGVSLTIQGIAAPAHVLTISPSATSPLLSTNEPATDRYFFRTIGVTRRGEALAQGLFSGAGVPPMCGSVVLIDDDSAFAQGYRDAYTEVFQKLGGCITGHAIVPGDAVSSYDAQIATIIAKKPDCVVLATLEVTLEFLRQAKAALANDGSHDWSKLTWLSASPAHGDDFVKNGYVDPAHPTVHVGEGIFVSDGDSNPPTPDYFKFRALYNDYFHLPPEQDTPPGVSNVFDAAILFALAVERAGSVRDRVAVRDGLWHVVGTTPDHAVYGPGDIREMLRILSVRNQFPGKCGNGPQSVPCEIRYRGASSELLFDPYGAVAVPSAIYQLVNGAFVLVRRYDDNDYDAFEARTPTPNGACPAP